MFRALVVLMLTAMAMTPAIASAQAVDPVTAAMEELLVVHELPGAALRVNKSRQVVYRQFVGGYDGNTRIPIASASKWVTALTIARLVDQGTMDWSDTVGQLMPQAPPDKAGITLAQLMSHTSGLPVDAVCLSSPLTTLAACAEFILRQPLVGDPGAIFAYGGASMQVAGRMAEMATGKPWDDIFLDEVVLPLGLVATDWAARSRAPGYVRSVNPRIAGGVRTSLDDYGALLDMVHARGLVGGQPFLSAATLTTMARDYTVGTIVLSTPKPGWGYGIGQWLETVDERGYAGGRGKFTSVAILSSPGAFGFYPWLDRLTGLSGVLMVQGQLGSLNDDIDAIRALVGRAVALPPAPCTQGTRLCPRPFPPAVRARAAPAGRP